jgi:hypothetical protein
MKQMTHQPVRAFSVSSELSMRMNFILRAGKR